MCIAADVYFFFGSRGRRVLEGASIPDSTSVTHLILVPFLIMAFSRPQLRVNTTDLPITIESESSPQVFVRRQSTPEHLETTTPGASGASASSLVRPHNVGTFMSGTALCIYKQSEPLFPHDRTMCRTMAMSREAYTSLYPPVSLPITPDLAIF